MSATDGTDTHATVLIITTVGKKLRHHLATPQINSIEPALPYVTEASSVSVSEIQRVFEGQTYESEVCPCAELSTTS